MVAEEPDAEEKTDKFAHIERDGDTKGRCSRAEQVNAANADILCKCIGSKIQNLSWYGHGRPGGNQEKGAEFPEFSRNGRVGKNGGDKR